MNGDWWPKILGPLVSEYGPDAVWDIGMRVLGYPVGWVHRSDEVLKVSRALKGETDG